MEIYYSRRKRARQNSKVVRSTRYWCGIGDLAEKKEKNLSFPVDWLTAWTDLDCILCGCPPLTPFQWSGVRFFLWFVYGGGPVSGRQWAICSANGINALHIYLYRGIHIEVVRSLLHSDLFDYWYTRHGDQASEQSSSQFNEAVSRYSHAMKERLQVE